VAELRLAGLGDTSPKIILCSDSSVAARSVTQCKGASIKHLSIKQLWIQSIIGSGRADLRKRTSESNEADIGTKALRLDRIRNLEHLLSYINVMAYRTHGEERTTSKQRRKAFGEKSANYLGITVLAAEATTDHCLASEEGKMTTSSSWSIIDMIMWLFVVYGFLRLLHLYCVFRKTNASENTTPRNPVVS
jgi:hypothetical protein